MEAVVDTASGATIMDPTLAEELNLKVKPWIGKIITVSGQRVLPHGRVYPKISDGTKSVEIEAIVMGMGAMRLLLWRLRSGSPHCTGD